LKNVYFLLGVSGCGKTKTIFDISKEKYTIILDFSEKNQMNEILNLLSNISIKVERQELGYEYSCREIVLKTFLSKYLFLIYLIGIKQIKSPKEWLYLQCDIELSEIFVKIYKQLNYDFSQMREIISDLNKWLKDDIVIAIDETNVLLQLYQNQFSDSTGNRKQRPLSSLIISTLTREISHKFPVIISGTHLRILDKQTLQSSVLSKSEQLEFIQVNGFRCNNSQEAYLFLKRFLNEKTKEIQEYLIDFQGRSRIVTDFISFLSNSNNFNFKEDIEKWRSEIITKNNEKSFYSLIHRFVVQNNDQWQRKLSDIIFAYFIDNGRMLVDFEETDFMATGFCFFKGCEGEKNIFYIGEPLVIETLRFYFKSRDTSIIKSMMLNQFQTIQSSQEKGRYLDSLIPLSFILKESEKTLFNNLYINEGNIPSWWNSEIDKIFNIEKISFKKMDEAFKEEWNEKEWIIPSTSSGNDGGIIGKIIILTGEKMSFQSSTVKTNLVEDNFQKTNIQGLYQHKTEDNDKLKLNQIKKDSIERNIKKREILGIIRIHIVLPKPAKAKTEEKKNIFQSGIRIIKNEYFDVDEIIIDIDKSNLKESGIFPLKASEFLLDQLKNEKKRGRKSKK